MTPTGLVLDRRFMDHRMGPGHVENPLRVRALLPLLEDPPVPIEIVPPRPATLEEAGRIHERAYLDFLASTAGRDFTPIDPDTAATAATWPTALLAAGGTIEAADRILEGRLRNGFALVRPPGHHAEAGRAMGFCFLNNVAIAAAHLAAARGLGRILVADFDLHHGNGTEHAFYERRDVLFFSTHQVPLYPGTGRAGETGRGEGAGYTVNVPLPAGKGDDDFEAVYGRVLAPIADRFRPEFVLVSAGFDIAAGDPLGGMRVTASGFGRIARALLGIAERHAGGRILFVLEGGYDPEALLDGVREILAVLGRPPGEAAEAGVARFPTGLPFELDPVFRAIKPYWEI